MRSLLVFLAILSFKSALAAHNQFNRVCYFAIKQELTVQNINATLCSHIIFAFASVSPGGELVPSSQDDIQWYEEVGNLKFRYPHVKVLLSVGGAGNIGYFHHVSENYLRRGQYVTS